MFLIVLLNSKVNLYLLEKQVKWGKIEMEYLFKSGDGHKVLQLSGLQHLMEIETQGPVNAVRSV